MQACHHCVAKTRTLPWSTGNGQETYLTTTVISTVALTACYALHILFRAVLPMATMVTLSVGNDATTDMWWRPVDMTHVAVATGVLQVVLPLLTACTTVTITHRFFSCVNIRFILEAKGSLRPPLFFAAGATESYATLVRLFSYYDLPVTPAFCWRSCFSFGVSEREIRVRTRANRANLRQTSCRAQRQGLWGLEALRLRGFGVWGFKDFARVSLRV